MKTIYLLNHIYFQYLFKMPPPSWSILLLLLLLCTSYNRKKTNTTTPFQYNSLTHMNSCCCCKTVCITYMYRLKLWDLRFSQLCCWRFQTLLPQQHRVTTQKTGILDWNYFYLCKKMLLCYKPFMRKYKKIDFIFKKGWVYTETRHKKIHLTEVLHDTYITVQLKIHSTAVTYRWTGPSLYLLTSCMFSNGYTLSLWRLFTFSCFPWSKYILLFSLITTTNTHKRF